MKTQIDTAKTHLTQTDLERVASLDEAELIPLLCHKDDCFVHGSELGIMTDEQASPPVEPTSPLQK